MGTRIAWISGIVGSILYTTMCGFLGYILNSYLSQDRIAIQGVTLVAEKEPMRMEHSMYHAVHSCQEDMYISTGFSSFESGYWLDREGAVRSGLEDSFLDYIHAQRTSITFRIEIHQ